MSLKKEFLAKKIDCPRCFVEMLQREMKVFGPNVTIDVCKKCNGIWLDTGELSKLLKNKSVTNYLTKNIGTQSKSKLVCPRCGGLMDLEYADDVEVDVCLSCHGVWLDAGELKDLQNISRKDFKGDEIDKAVERWEDYIKSQRGSFWSKLKGK